MAENKNDKLDVYAYLQGCAQINPEAENVYNRLQNFWRDFLTGISLELPGSEFTELDVFNERLEKIAAEANVLPDVCLKLREAASAHYAKASKPRTLEQKISLEFGEDGLPARIVTHTKTNVVHDFIPETYRQLYGLCDGENKVEEFLKLYETAKGLEPKLVHKEGAMGIFDSLTAPESYKMFRYILEKNLLDKHVEQLAENPEARGFAHEGASQQLFSDFLDRLDYCTKQNPMALHYVTEETAVTLLRDAQKVMDDYIARKQFTPKIVVNNKF